jgi:hypothetical protein
VIEKKPLQAAEAGLAILERALTRRPVEAAECLSVAFLLTSGGRPAPTPGRHCHRLAGFEQRLQARENGRPTLRDAMKHLRVGLKLLVGDRESHCLKK